MFEVVSGLLALVLLSGIAFPQLFGGKTEKKKTVGSSYWGVYTGTPTEDLADGKIEAPEPGRKWNVVAGSHMYAGSSKR